MRTKQFIILLTLTFYGRECQANLINVTLTILQCGLLSYNCDPINYGELFMHCFVPEKDPSSFLVNSAGASEFYDSDLYNPLNKLAIYTHGFDGSYYEGESGTLKNAYLQVDKSLFCMVDAKEAFGGLNYVQAARNTKCIGRQIAEFLAELFKMGYDPNLVQIIGHSLGAQASGYAGRIFQEITNGVKIGKVTGLDPAGPCFNPPTESNKVSSTDAVLVDVYHCNEGLLGSVAVGGCADFYPNCGTFQSGCSSSSCSHTYCVKFYAASILEKINCISVSTHDCLDFIGDKHKQITTQPGYYWDGVPGFFYFWTNDDIPICKGNLGI